jgi:hypothetical protein
VGKAEPRGEGDDGRDGHEVCEVEEVRGLAACIPAGPVPWQRDERGKGDGDEKAVVNMVRSSRERDG